MNRNQRRLGRIFKKNDNENKIKTHKAKNVELEEVLGSQRARKEPAKLMKSLTNRSCFARPNLEDFGQFTDHDISIEQERPYKQYGLKEIIPHTIAQLRELKNILCDKADQVENSPQYEIFDHPTNKLANLETSVGSQWQNIENIDDIDKVIKVDKFTLKDSIPLQYAPIPKNVHISEVPRVKIIAKKFSRCKKHNIEVRKLDEKVVCLEYDVFEESDLNKPIQAMRAFFSIKPICEDEERKENIIASVPVGIKRNFQIEDDDLKSLNEKEIEIIDGKIIENKPYLDDLKKILLRKKKETVKTNKNSLDLSSLYEMAKRERFTNENFDTNILTKAELKEVKDLILANCTSSIYGISRRTIKNEKEESNLNKSDNIGVVSQSIFAELLREDAKTNVFQ